MAHTDTSDDECVKKMHFSISRKRITHTQTPIVHVLHHTEEKHTKNQQRSRKKRKYNKMNSRPCICKRRREEKKCVHKREKMYVCSSFSLLFSLLLLFPYALFFQLLSQSLLCSLDKQFLSRANRSVEGSNCN